MGILDDAIREHLDLKRRRGADPTEIERAEREALGPVRRGPELTGDEVAAPEPAEAPAAEHAAAPSEEWERFPQDPELRALEEEEPAPYEPPRAPDGDPLVDDEPAFGETHSAIPPDPVDLASAPEAGPPPAPHPADPPPAPAPARDDEPATRVDQETEEYELEPEEEEEETGDDVLETTPEFLQDTPEHDRLWFEQRPPRDFDFDG